MLRRQVPDHQGRVGAEYACLAWGNRTGWSSPRPALRLCFRHAQRDYAGWFCGVPFQTANAFTFGRSVPDEEHVPELLVIWAQPQPHVGGPSAGRPSSTSVESGSKIVVIDPRKIDLAGVADLWIRPVRHRRRPSDGAPQDRGGEGLHDAEFARAWTPSASTSSRPSWLLLAGRCGCGYLVPEEQIVQLAG